MIPKARIAIPIPMPAFTPLLIPGDGPPAMSEGFGVCVETAEAEEIGVEVTNVVALEVEVLVVLNEVEEVEVSAVDLRTRNPGLDSSPAPKSNVDTGNLNRRTYFALIARTESGMSIVQAKFPAWVMLMFTCIMLACTGLDVE